MCWTGSHTFVSSYSCARSVKLYSTCGQFSTQWVHLILTKLKLDSNVNSLTCSKIWLSSYSLTQLLPTKRSSPQKGDYFWCFLDITEELGVIFPPLHILLFQQRNSGDLCQQEGNIERRDHTEVLSTLKSGRCWDEQSNPEQDLPQVIWVTDHTPQAMTDPLVTVSRIASEGILLVVSHHFKKHSSKPNGPPNVVTCAELFVFFLKVQDQGGEECEKHPHTCTEKMMCVNFTSPERDVRRLVCNSSIEQNSPWTVQ